MAKRYLISVGINDYVDCKNLNFCVKDALDITNVFVNACNVDSEDIRIITSEKKKPDSDPWKTFCEVIENLKSEFQCGDDDVFFYFSGHGIPSSETTVIFKNKTITISDINNKLEELSPKTKILIFDSCYSGKGYIETDKSAQFFSQSSKQTSGYYILCACSDSETAKETSELSNGRFTHFLLAMIYDLQNYNKYGILDVNVLFSKVDQFFKENPDLKQSPFQQIKSIGSYPIANSFNENSFYARFKVEDIYDFDWSEMIRALNLYLNTKENIIGELLRFVREYCDNTLNKTKGNANQQLIEISKNKVLLIDNGEYFNLFDPPTEIKTGGGVKTAKEFTEIFGDFFSYSTFSENGFNYYSFEFLDLNLNEVCTLNIDMSTLRKLRDGLIVIDERCNDFTIKFGQFTMMHSLVHMSIENLAKESQRTNKIIYMDFYEGDRFRSEAEKMIENYGATNYIKTRTYKD